MGLIEDVFLEFLECYIHGVVFHCQIYPQDLFDRKKKYSVNVAQCRHPDVNSYIKRVLVNLSDLLNDDVVSTINVVLKTPTGQECAIIGLSPTIKKKDADITNDDVRFLEDGFRKILLGISLFDWAPITKHNIESWDIGVEIKQSIGSKESVVQGLINFPFVHLSN